MATELSLHGIPGIPLIHSGDSLSQLLLTACQTASFELRQDDVLVVAQKIVSKSEGRTVELADVQPSDAAISLARRVDKDPRLVELILQESRQVIRHKPGVLVVEDNRGLILANAGIDHSNVAQRAHSENRAEPKTSTVLLLPVDPDASALRLRKHLETATGLRLGVIICDSLGRAWRVGTAGVAIGCSGIPSVLDLRGQQDIFGVELRTTDVAHADQLAAAASIIMGQAAEALPVVVARGARAITGTSPNSPATALLRDEQQDMFR